MNATPARERVITVIREQLSSTDYPVSDWERGFADAILSALSGAGGYRLVPVEMTTEMRLAGEKAEREALLGERVWDIWAAMLAVSPDALRPSAPASVAGSGENRAGWKCNNCQTVFTAASEECRPSEHHDPSPYCPHCKAWNQYTYPYQLHYGDPCEHCGVGHDDVSSGPCLATPASDGLREVIDRVFSEPVVDQAAEFGVNSNGYVFAGQWRDCVRKTALLAALSDQPGGEG